MLYVYGVTFDHTTNYGSCLQAYALQHAIEAMEIDGQKCSYQLIPYSAFPRESVHQGSIITKGKRFLKGSITKYRRSRFIGFENKYMHYADCYSEDELKELNREADAFVCGSDVIWNLNFTQGKDYYFLGFADRYKFSYAASFGVTDIHHDYDKIDFDPAEMFRKSLPALNRIGVREKKGVEIVRSIIGRDAEQVCDPVILLTREQWDGVAAKKKKRKPYIFAYSTYTSPNYMTFLNKLRKQTGLPVIHVTWDIKSSITKGAAAFPTPEEWICLLRDAEYVVTNSFHGSAFCALYHKTFYCAMRDGQVLGTRIRLYDFLDDMGLRSRIFGNTPEIIDTTVPDFTETDKAIAAIREKSTVFLRENLEAAAHERRDCGN